MMNARKREHGLSLLETMLALGIAAALIAMGMATYESYKRDADALALAANIDMLAQAASYYYYAQCYGETDTSTGAVVPGKLNPAYYSGNTAYINFQTDLINSGYLSQPLRANPLVDDTVLNGGYAVSFARTMSPKMIDVCADPPTCSSTTSTSIGTIDTWTIVI